MVATRSVQRSLQSSQLVFLTQQRQRQQLPSLLLSSARASATTSLLPSRRIAVARRSFQSSTKAAAGWTPSWSWIGMGGSQQATTTPSAFEKEVPLESDEIVTSAAAAASSSPPPAVPEAAATLPTPTPIAEAVDAAPTFMYDSISTGTLDLTSLAGSWGIHPIMRLESMFLHLHESFPLLAPTSGLPWYILIPTVTLILRLLLFTFQVKSQANAGRMALIQPQMIAGMNKVKEAKARGDVVGAQAAQMETAKLMSDHGVNPLRNFMFPLAQATIFMSMFFALRGLGTSGLESISTEGMLWFPDLTKPDGTYMLPIASTTLTLATLESGVDSTTQVQTSTTKNMKSFFRAMLIISLPFIAYFPAILLLYWTTNNFLSLIQTLFLKINPVRRFFGIPIVPPKAQPGEIGYVKEPGFMEAFKDIQVSAKERFDTMKEDQERSRILAQQRKGVRGTWERTEAVRSMGPERKAVGPVRRVLEEVTGVEESSGTSEIKAEEVKVVEKVGGGGKEEQKAKRIQQARLRRQQR